MIRECDNSWIATIPVKAGSVAFGPHGQTLATTSGDSVILWTPAS
jgi:hypothetical protein